MRELPIIKIGHKKYYVDERLNELRNITNPSDRESMEGSDEAFWVGVWGEKKRKH